MIEGIHCSYTNDAYSMERTGKHDDMMIQKGIEG